MAEGCISDYATAVEGGGEASSFCSSSPGVGVPVDVVGLRYCPRGFS